MSSYYDDEELGPVYRERDEDAISAAIEDREATDSLLALDLEYRLTIAHRISCECATYLVDRREVLIPAVLERAKAKRQDPVDMFAAFARGIHDRHGGGDDTHRIAGRFAALMALVSDPDGA